MNKLAAIALTIVSIGVVCSMATILLAGKAYEYFEYDRITPRE